METPKIYFPYCNVCDEWTRPHRVINDVYCSDCGVYQTTISRQAIIPFGKYNGRNVFGMVTWQEKGYLKWMLENVERLDLNLRLAILYQLDFLPAHLPGLAPPWWAQHLSLTLPCSADQIKAAYRELSKKYHPDAGGTTEQMQRLNEAKTLATAYLESR